MNDRSNVATIRRYLWVVAVGAMFAAYILKPFWPHSAALLALRWWVAPLFLATVLLLCKQASQGKLSTLRAAMLTLWLVAYLFSEGALANLAYITFMPLRPVEPEGYLFAGMVNVFWQSPVVMLFMAFCLAEVLIYRFGPSGSRG